MSGRQALRRLWQQGSQVARAGAAQQQYAYATMSGSLAPRLGIASRSVLPKYKGALLQQHGSSAQRAFFTSSLRAAAEAGAAKGAAGKAPQQRVRAAASTALAWVRTFLGGVRAVGRQGARALEGAGSTPTGKAAQLQIASIWQAHGGKITLAAGALFVYLVYRVSFATASTFVNFSHSMANYGFLAMAVALVLLGYQYLRARHTLNPNRVYQLAMLQLNAHAGVLEVMGAPLKGSEVRAYVVTGRRLYWKGLRPKVAPHRMQIMFPLEGAKKRGLASVEAKKKQGKIKFKLLSVDLPAAGGEPSGRLYLVGDEAAYSKGSVLGELRDPFLKALSLQDKYQAEDEQEAEAEEQAADREHQRQQRQQQQQQEQEQESESPASQQPATAQQERQEGQERPSAAATIADAGQGPTPSISRPAERTGGQWQTAGSGAAAASAASASAAAGAAMQSSSSGAKERPGTSADSAPQPSGSAGASTAPTTEPARSFATAAPGGDGAAPTPAPSAVPVSVERTARQPTPRAVGWRQWLYGKEA